jgi:hypothetical protein
MTVEEARIYLDQTIGEGMIPCDACLWSRAIAGWLYICSPDELNTKDQQQVPSLRHVHRLKLIKRQGYGRASFPLLRQRVLYQAL